MIILSDKQSFNIISLFAVKNEICFFIYYKSKKASLKFNKENFLISFNAIFEKLLLNKKISNKKQWSQHRKNLEKELESVLKDFQNLLLGNERILSIIKLIYIENDHYVETAKNSFNCNKFKNLESYTESLFKQIINKSNLN